MPNYNENQNNYGNLNESNENGGFQEFEKRPNGKEKLRLFFNNRRNRAIAAILAVVILASSVCAVVFSKGIGSKKTDFTRGNHSSRCNCADFRNRFSGNETCGDFGPFDRNFDRSTDKRKDNS